MGTLTNVDAVTWQGLGLLLTVLGLVVAFAGWRRHGAATGLRLAAWSLLPLAAGLTGTLRLLAEIIGSIGRWATRLVFSPTVWLGLVVLGLAVVLFVVSAVLRHTARGTRGSAAPPARRTSTALVRATRPVSASGPASSEDDEVEAILRKHGIS